jgi:hypothetical protein
MTALTTMRNQALEKLGILVSSNIRTTITLCKDAHNESLSLRVHGSSISRLPDRLTTVGHSGTSVMY